MPMPMPMPLPSPTAFSLPLAIGSGSDYDAKKTRALYESVALDLAKQAFWLEIFELLERRPEIAGVKFTHERKADRIALAIGRDGTPGAKVLGAQKALSKARGKFSGSQADQMRDHLRRATAKNELITLDKKEQTLLKAWGPALYAARLAALESVALEGALKERAPKTDRSRKGRL